MSTPPWQVQRERGSMRTDWLDARFSLDFAGYANPRWPRFGPLLALNEDRVAPGGGFPMHAHRDLDILMLPYRGAIAHEDTLGHRFTVGPGEAVFMRAGRGIAHSQLNASAAVEDHHFQLWLEPPSPGLEPFTRRLAYQRPVAGGWTLIASPDGRRDSFPLEQPVQVLLGRAGPGAGLQVEVPAGSNAWLHVMEGGATAALDPPERLAAGQALVLQAAARFSLAATGAGTSVLLVLVSASRVLRNLTSAVVRAGR